ncbi:MAG: phenylacetic acid degradation b [Cyclobacteriaceae bacterium]|nr:phenylacetic acid degradation b [Cyclobacteriaceae bacterium]
MPKINEPVSPKAPLDQFGTFEVFVQPKEGKPFQHEGSVHAPDLELAWVLAKETFTRRFTCTSLYVVDTREVYVSPFTEGDKNAYDLLPEITEQAGSKKDFEIYQLTKRGKQHVHVGTVQAVLPQEAMVQAAKLYNTGNIVYNVWAIATAAIRFTTPEEKELWLTLPEKKFRDASDYKGGNKLKEFLERKLS